MKRPTVTYPTPGWTPREQAAFWRAFDRLELLCFDPTSPAETRQFACRLIGEILRRSKVTIH